MQLVASVNAGLVIDLLQLPSIVASLPLRLVYLGQGLQQLYRRHQCGPSRISQPRRWRQSLLEQLPHGVEVANVGLVAFLVLGLLFLKEAELDRRVTNCRLQRRLGALEAGLSGSEILCLAFREGVGGADAIASVGTADVVGAQFLSQPGSEGELGLILDLQRRILRLKVTRLQNRIGAWRLYQG